jgi:hypothetical protein
MFTDDWMKATVSGYIGTPAHDFNNVWSFKCLAASDANSLAAIGSYIVPSLLAFFYEPIAAVVSNKVIVNHVALRDYGDVTEGYDWIGAYVAGLYEGLPLPPFVTYNIELQRDNYLMNNGRKGIPGVASTSLDVNGNLSDSVKAYITDAIVDRNNDWNVEAGAAEYTFGLKIVREPATPGTVPTVFSNITVCAAKSFGTQNSRK